MFGSADAWFSTGDCEPVVLPFLADLPPITLELDGVSIAVPATQSYATTIAERTCPTLLVRDWTGVAALPMRSSVVVFDRARHRIGFAPPTPCPGEAPRPAR